MESLTLVFSYMMPDRCVGDYIDLLMVCESGWCDLPMACKALSLASLLLLSSPPFVSSHLPLHLDPIQSHPHQSHYQPGRPLMLQT